MATIIETEEYFFGLFANVLRWCYVAKTSNLQDFHLFAIFKMVEEAFEEQGIRTTLEDYSKLIHGQLFMSNGSRNWTTL